MTGYVDLHSHLLPGLDDGPKDWEETVRMARRGWDDGTRVFAMTPHLFWDHRENRRETVQRLTEEAGRLLQEHGLPLRIVPGMEVPTREGSLALLREDRVPTLGAGHCVLLEPPFAGVPDEMDRFVGAFVERGFRILLAHPERCRSLQERPDLLDAFLPPDAVLQLTSHSLTGFHGEKAWETAMIYLQSGRPMILASDAHSSQARPPLLSEGVRVAAEVVGEAAALHMVTDLPLALLEDLPLPPRP